MLVPLSHKGISDMARAFRKETCDSQPRLSSGVSTLANVIELLRVFANTGVGASFEASRSPSALSTTAPGRSRSSWPLGLRVGGDVALKVAQTLLHSLQARQCAVPFQLLRAAVARFASLL